MYNSKLFNVCSNSFTCIFLNFLNKRINIMYKYFTIDALICLNLYFSLSFAHVFLFYYLMTSLNRLKMSLLHRKPFSGLQAICLCRHVTVFMVKEYFPPMTLSIFSTMTLFMLVPVAQFRYYCRKS